MIDERIIKLALDFLLKFPDEGMNILNSDLCMPNIPFPTMGGHTFWTNLCEYQGYKLQQNQFTHHARILDSNDIRIAWGTGKWYGEDIRTYGQYGNKIYKCC